MNHRIVFLGDSLTAGFGLGEDEAYPALIQEKIGTSRKDVNVVNAGVNGDTSAGGVQRIDWLLKEPIDVLLLALGANDGLRGLPVTAMKENLRTIIRSTRAKNPNTCIILAGMMVPPNQGSEYSQSYRESFLQLAQEEKVPLVPFLLEGVAGVPRFNQPDGLHPTAEGQRMIAENVWRVFGPIVRKLGANPECKADNVEAR